MHKSNRFAFINFGQIILDVLMLSSAYFISYFCVSSFTQLKDLQNYIWILIVYIPIWVLCMNSLKMYNRTTFNYYDRILRNILISALASGVFLAALIFYIKETMFSRMLYCTYISVGLALVLIERYSYVCYIKKYRNIGARQAIVVGLTDIESRFEQYYKKTNLRINILGYVRVSGDSPNGQENILGNIDDLEDILVKNVVDEVIFTLPKYYVGEVEKYVLLCEKMGVTVRLVLDLYDLKISKTHLSSIGPLPMLTFHSVCLNRGELFMKRFIDILGAIVGILLSIIPSIIVAIAIKIDSPGPIFFSQYRAGLNGRKFKLYKFRSMYIDAEERKKELSKQNQVSGGLMFKIKSDPRITKVGNILRKTSLDELPQFINVLKGDMSLVGTRPPTLDEVSKYEIHHHRRISFKPGITGLWQISGRSEITNFEEVVRLDTKYIDEWSIWLDIKILIKTFLVVFDKKGAM